MSAVYSHNYDLLYLLENLVLVFILGMVACLNSRQLAKTLLDLLCRACCTRSARRLSTPPSPAAVLQRRYL